MVLQEDKDKRLRPACAVKVYVILNDEQISYMYIIIYVFN